MLRGIIAMRRDQVQAIKMGRPQDSEFYSSQNRPHLSAFLFLSPFFKLIAPVCGQVCVYLRQHLKTKLTYSRKRDLEIVWSQMFPIY